MALKKGKPHIKCAVIPTPFTRFGCEYPQIKAESLTFGGKDATKKFESMLHAFIASDENKCGRNITRETERDKG